MHQLMLVDFGAATQVVCARTSTETMIGSAEYAAPEQIRDRAVFAIPDSRYAFTVECYSFKRQLHRSDSVNFNREDNCLNDFPQS
jgi:serine/threonine protein kinase